MSVTPTDEPFRVIWAWGRFESFASRKAAEARRDALLAEGGRWRHNHPHYDPAYAAPAVYERDAEGIYR